MPFVSLAWTDKGKPELAICYACPMCRQEEPDFKTVPYVALNREIRELHVYCANKEKGCKWQGEINNINNHLYGCLFGEVKCSNECGKMIQRRYLASHVETECPRRKVNCQYCHDTGEHQFIEGQHKEECPKLPLPCPNKCEVGSVSREDMEAHRKECPLEMIQCEYYSVGCEVRMARKDMEEHKKKNMEEHSMMTNYELTDTISIYCTNKEKGCEWQGKQNDIYDHLGNSDGCQFVEVKCSNECGKMIQRQYLNSHVENECPRRKIDHQLYHHDKQPSKILVINY